LPAQPHNVVAFFAQPLVAAGLGVVLGAGMVLLTRWSVTFMDPEIPELGVARALALSGLGMVAAFVALMLYFLYARNGLVPFGLGMVAGFLVPAFVMLFRFSGIARPSSGGGR
jgi:hypothetical protein